MVLVVLNDGAGVFEDGEVCCPSRREGAHGVTLPEDLEGLTTFTGSPPADHRRRQPGHDTALPQDDVT
jgi:hypothetical protein